MARSWCGRAAWAPAIAAALAAAAGRGEASGVGEGFGERFASLMSARQAGSGGVALEDPWRGGDLVDVTSVVLEPDLRWVGFGYQFGGGSLLRVMTEGFYFGAPGSPMTKENPDGSYAGRSGDVDFRELGCRILGQGLLLQQGGWTIGGLARGSFLVQQFERTRDTGQAVEVGGQASRGVGGRRLLTLWSLVGPLGRGDSRAFAYHVVAGAGLLARLSRGLLGSPGGWAVGCEGEWLAEGLMHGGLGAVYWFGDLSSPGVSLTLRSGVRSATGSAQSLQPRGGAGFLWRVASGWAVQFDYAVAPIGELGFYHYATVSVRLPERAPPEQVAEVLEAVPVRPVPTETGDLRDPGLFFYPEIGETARYRFAASPEEAVSMRAYLADGEGRFLIWLAQPASVGEGFYEAYWDGLLQYGVRATIDVPYTIVIGAGGRTIYVTVTAKRK